MMPIAVLFVAIASFAWRDRDDPGGLGRRNDARGAVREKETDANRASGSSSPMIMLACGLNGV
jgi:hypothetical protein